MLHFALWASLKNKERKKRKGEKNLVGFFFPHSFIFIFLHVCDSDGGGREANESLCLKITVTSSICTYCEREISEKNHTVKSPKISPNIN